MADPTLVPALDAIYKALKNSHPKLARGRVWCRRCGKISDVSVSGCLIGGWPEHCGETMSIDAPQED